MDIFSMIVSILGGLALFLYGMNVMSSGLEKLAGGKIEGILEKLTSNRFKGLLLGVIVTALIQSSSAMTVMLVGLVNSGVMQLSQAVSVTMGSNIGTTVTSWVLSLTGIEGDSFFLTLLKPTTFSPILAFIGILMIMVSKKPKQKDTGTIFVGFAVLMYGMSFVSGAVEPLAELEGFTSILTAFSNPILGVLAGAIFTAVIQSSSASVGVLQALSMTGKITYASAIPIIMGQNIGTCITAIISSIGANKNARRVAVVHLLFNLTGTIILLAIWSIVRGYVLEEFAMATVEPFSIAIMHSIFNVATTVLLFPFAKLLEKGACMIIKDSRTAESKKVAFLDERLFTVPSIAVAKSMDAAKSMAGIAENSVIDALSLISKYDVSKADDVVASEKVLDTFEDKLGTYLVKLSKCQLTDNDARDVSTLLHIITDFERIGDHAENLVAVSKEMSDKNISFSHEARDELNVLASAISEILSSTVKAFKEEDLVLAQKIEPLEQVIDNLITEIRTRHISRLQKGSCTIELGFVLTDFLTNCDRISDHCSNIAVAMIEVSKGTFDTHKYIRNIKAQPNSGFKEQCEEWQKRFQIKHDI